MFSTEEIAMLTAKLPNVECENFAPYIKFNDEEKSIRIIGKRKPYLEKSPVKEYFIFIPLMAVWAVLISALLNPLETTIRDSLFAFVPNEYISSNYDVNSFSREKLLITAIFGIIANGFIAPVCEELYFRGYILPRINLSPLKAAVLNAALFSIYHFYSPWYFFSRVIMMIPLYYWVAKKKNVRFAVLAHIISNTVTSVMFLISVI